MKLAPVIVIAILLALGPAAPAVADTEMNDSPCYECHTGEKTSFASGTVHEPVSSGECDSCHKEHGADNKLVLTEEIPELCYGCHDALTMVSQHEPAKSGDCLDCHSVHNAQSGALLSKEIPELCNDCHEGYDKSKGVFPHEPVAGGECSECHLSHESQYGSLLKDKYDQERYAIYASESYTLCYNCHDKAIFEERNTLETGFRDGPTNLHYLHMVKTETNKYGMKKPKEGMTCMGCHLTHGGPQAKLIRVNLECGATYCYTMNYRKFEGGGTCVVGCHKPKVYRASGSGATPADIPVAQQAPAAPTTP